MSENDGVESRYEKITRNVVKRVEEEYAEEKIKMGDE